MKKKVKLQKQEDIEPLDVLPSLETIVQNANRLPQKTDQRPILQGHQRIIIIRTPKTTQLKDHRALRIRTGKFCKKNAKPSVLLNLKKLTAWRETMFLPRSTR